MAFMNPHMHEDEHGLPPEEVRVIELRAEPWPEGDRVRIHLELTPFQKRPNLHIAITNSANVGVTEVDIIEAFETRMTFTMHLRDQKQAGPFTLSASIYYPEMGTVAQSSTTFETPQPSD
jgi:hypothetical protein